MPRYLLLLLGCGCWGLSRESQAAEPTVPPIQVSRQVDEAFAKLWAEADVRPASLADDATFLRRVSLDLTGCIPDVRRVREFLADQRPDKRQRLIENLLGTTEHSAHLARVLTNVILPDTGLGGPTFEGWLFRRLQEGASWKELTLNLVDPNSGTGPLKEQGTALLTGSAGNKPQKVADVTARVFLGLQMGCAECHDHPFHQWTREEFWNFTAFFADVSPQNPMVFGSRIVAVESKGGPQPILIPDTDKFARPQFPGTKEPLMPTGESYRSRLAAWMVAADNPWFARAAVNRAWSLMFGRGLVEPVDDLTAADAVLTKEILDLLAKDFVANGYDLNRLLTILAGTRAYQLASHAEPCTRVRPELFHVMAVRSLTAEQIYACLTKAVSGRRSPAGQLPVDAMEKQQFLTSLTAPTQSATEFQAGIPQMLSLLNGPLVARMTDVQKCDLLAALEDGPFFTDQDRLVILYLATLSRNPTQAERQRVREFLAKRRETGSHGQELGDLLWVLLNSSEFLLNH